MAIKLKRPLTNAVLPFADRRFDPGDKIFLRREKILSRRIGEWLGPFEVSVVDYDKKLVYVRDDANIPAKPFNVSQVKSYLTGDFLFYSFVAELDMSLKIFLSAG